MGREQTVALVKKRIQKTRFHWLVLGLSFFFWAASLYTYMQGYHYSQAHGFAEEYGDLFWHGVDVQATYSGTFLWAQGRFDTALLYALGGIVIFCLWFLALVNLKFYNRILDMLNQADESTKS